MSVARAIRQQAYGRLSRRLFPPFSVDPRASHQAALATGRPMMELREEVLAHALALGHHGFATGHVPCRPGLVDAFQHRWAFVTVLRDPVERWISEFVYNSEKDSDWATNDLSLEAYLDSPAARVTGTSFLRYFSRAPQDLEGDLGPYVTEAVQNLERFAVVGSVEDMASFVDAFQARFGVRLRVPRRNRSPDRDQKARIRENPDTIRRIRMLCSEDLQVYEAVRQPRPTPPPSASP